MGKLLVFVVSMFFVAQAWAGDVVVNNAWIRATAPGQENATLQFSILSQKKGQLVKVECAEADSVELHSMSHENGMMMMREIDAIDLPEGEDVDLAASGKHVMLVGLGQPLKSGEIVPFMLTVQFADGSSEVVKAVADVRPLTSAEENQAMPGM